MGYSHSKTLGGGGEGGGPGNGSGTSKLWLISGICKLLILQVNVIYTFAASTKTNLSSRFTASSLPITVWTPHQKDLFANPKDHDIQPSL